MFVPTFAKSKVRWGFFVELPRGSLRGEAPPGGACETSTDAYGANRHMSKYSREIPHKEGGARARWFKFAQPDRPQIFGESAGKLPQQDRHNRLGTQQRPPLAQSRNSPRNDSIFAI